MELHRTAIKAFLMWLAVVAVGLATYMLHLGPLQPELFRNLFVAALIALSVIYLVLRATKISKSFATILAASWFIGPSILFAIVPYSYGGLLIFLLLLLAVSQNILLSMLLRRGASF